MSQLKYHLNRATRARKTLEFYKGICLKESGPVDLEDLRDLIQDAMHWQTMRDPDGDAGESIREAAETAIEDFPHELLEAPDV